MKYRNTLIPFVFIALLTSCGGSSSSSSDSSGASNTPPPNDDNSKAAIVFKTDNDSFGALSLSLAATEGILQSSQSFVSRVVEFSQGNNFLGLGCSSDEAFSVNFDDSDNSLTLSTGDVLTLTYTDCNDTLFQDIVDGKVEVVIDTFSAGSAGVHLLATVDFGKGLDIRDRDANSAANSVRIQAHYELEYHLSPGEETGQGETESLTATALGDQYFSLDDSGSIEHFSEFSVNKTYAKDASPIRTTVSLNLHADSDILGHTFNCESPKFSEFISSGSFVTCFGLNNNAIRTTGTRDPIQIDTKGNGNFKDTKLALSSYHNFLEGFLFSPRTMSLSEFPDVIATKRLPISAEELAFDPTLDRTLVITSNDASYGQSLLSFDEKTNQVSKLLSLEYEPSLIRFSRDHSRIYLVYKDRNIIDLYDSMDLNRIRRYTVDADRILDLQTSPIDVNRFALVQELARRTDVLIFNADKQLSSTFMDMTNISTPDFVDTIAYAANGQFLVATNPNSSGSFRINLSNQGVQSADELYHSNVAFDVEKAGDWFLSRNRILIQESLALHGTIDASGVKHIDSRSNRVYSVSRSAISVFHSVNLAKISQYQLNISSPRQVVSTDSHVMIREDGVIRLIEKNLLETNLNSNCPVEAHSNEKGKKFFRLHCYIRDAVFDSNRNKIYALIDSRNDVIGNSLAIINSETLEVESYHPLLLSPQKLVQSGNGNFAYVQFSQSDLIARVELNSGDYSMTTISLGVAKNGIARRPLNIYSSPTVDDTVVVAVGANNSSCPFSSLISIVGGIRSFAKVSADEIPGIREGYCGFGKAFGFDSDGSFYVYGPTDSSQSDTATISQFLVNNMGVHYLSTFEATSTTDANGDENIHITNGLAITRLGETVDLTSQHVELRYDLQSDSPESSLLTFGISSVPTRNEVYYLLNDRTSDGRVLLRSFDQDSGEVNSNFVFPLTHKYLFGKRMLNVRTFGLPSGLLLIASSNDSVSLMYLIPAESME